MQTLIQDVRFGLRMLLKKPGFTLIAIITLALGIGANTAIFSVVNAVMLKPLSYKNAPELTAIFFTNQAREFEGPMAYGIFLDLKKESSLFTDVAAWNNKGWPVNLTGSGEPERLQGYQVSANMFSTLGVAPALGRTFLAEEEQLGNNRVVVLSHELWRRRFGGDVGLIGQSITLNGEPHQVIGIMPDNFRLAAKTDLWSPMALTAAEQNDRDINYLHLIARLKPGVSPEQARAAVEGLTKSLINSSDSKIMLSLKPLQQILIGDANRMLWMLFAAVGFVLLIACTNVANLLLARASARRKELAIRIALGAGRWRVVRQLFVESLMLAILGGACGLMLADYSMKFLVSGLPESLLDANSNVALLKLDFTALGFTSLLAVLTTILFGLVPAIQTSNVNLTEDLKDGRTSNNQGAQQNRMRSVLVVTEIALAMVLLVSAGLMIKSFWKLSNTNPGFESSGVLMADIDPSGENYKDLPRVVAFYQNYIERIKAIPGVQEAGAINSLGSSWPFSIVEHPPVPEDQQPSASNNQVSPDYFRAMQIPLRAGRFFTDRDVKGAPLVAIIDETLARRFFQNENPIGKHIKYQKAVREIVGVVGAIKIGSLSRDSFQHVYLPYQQENWWSMSLVVRTNAKDPMSLMPYIRRELASIDKNQPIHSFRTLKESVNQWNASERFSTILLAAFASLAAILAAIGIYGVMSYTVVQRTNEIGIRMALGAQTLDVLNLIIGYGIKLAFAGLLIGLAGAFALTRLMKTMLFDVSTSDPTTYFVIALLLASVAIIACYLPARRATKVDPLVALRYE